MKRHLRMFGTMLLCSMITVNTHAQKAPLITFFDKDINEVDSSKAFSAEIGPTEWLSSPNPPVTYAVRFRPDRYPGLQEVNIGATLSNNWFSIPVQQPSYSPLSQLYVHAELTNDFYMHRIFAGKVSCLSMLISAGPGNFIFDSIASLNMDTMRCRLYRNISRNTLMKMAGNIARIKTIRECIVVVSGYKKVQYKRINRRLRKKGFIFRFGEYQSW